MAENQARSASGGEREPGSAPETSAAVKEAFTATGE